MQEFPPLLNESDLHIAQLTLMLLTSIGTDYKEALAGIERIGILNEVRNLLRSPLLQGNRYLAVIFYLFLLEY